MIMAINFDKICRSCKTEANEMFPIFKGRAGDRPADLLNSFTNIGAKADDGLPSKICRGCTDDLNRFVAFKHKTERTDYDLRQYLKSPSSILTDISDISTASLNIKIELDPFIASTPPNAEYVDDDSDADCKTSDLDEKPSDLPDQMDFIDDSNRIGGIGLEETSSEIVLKSETGAKVKQAKKRAARLPKLPKHKPSSDDGTARISEGKFFQCSACKSCFGIQVALRQHIGRCKERSQESKATVNCKNCTTTFRQVSHLNRHIANQVCLRRKVVKEKAPIKKYHCAHCKKVYERRHKLLKHLLVHGFSPKFPCRNCVLEFEKDEMREHVLAQHTLHEHLCSVCGKVFALNNSLRTHMMRHNPDKAFKCTVCPFSSIARADLESHMTKHTGEHPFECDICGHRSTTRSARARHKRIHTGEKKHACDLCPMRFAVAYGLKNHRRTHTGEKPYACDQCDRTFTQRTECVWHKRSHIEGYMFQCTLCTLSFARHSSLKEHRKTHAVQKRVRQSKNVGADVNSPIGTQEIGPPLLNLAPTASIVDTDPEYSSKINFTNLDELKLPLNNTELST